MATRTSVTPTFIFGLNSSHFSPLTMLDSWMYKTLGFTMPVWLPTQHARQPVTMVVGDPIDCAGFENVEDLADFYYSQVKSLYCKHRCEVGGERYAGVEIEFVESERSAASGASNKVSALRNL